MHLHNSFCAKNEFTLMEIETLMVLFDRLSINLSYFMTSSRYANIKYLKSM